MPIRLAHILNWDGSGGGNKQALTLLDGWADHPDIEPWAVHAANLNSPGHFVAEPDDSRPYPLLYPSNIADGLREIEPDIVFVHGFSPKLSDLLRNLAEDDTFDAKFVLRKGMNLFEHWGLIFRHNDSRKLTYQVAEFDFYDCIVCPTVHTRDRVSMFYAEDCPRLAYIPNAIKRDQYVPSSFMKGGVMTVITASRGGPNEFLLSPLLAAIRLADAGEVPLELRMFGASFQPIDTTIRSLAEGYDNVHVEGYKHPNLIMQHMEVADVVCVPSISHQAIPLAALEGLASGNIVLTSFPEAHEEEALIRLPATHPPAWYNAIKDVYDDPEDARDWIRKGIEAAVKYDVSQIVPAYVNVFKALVSESKPSCQFCGRVMGNPGALAQHEVACEEAPA